VYSWTQIKKDFIPASWLAIGLMLAVFIGAAIIENLNIVTVFLKDPWEVSGVILVVTGLLIAVLLSYRSWYFIAHLGWKRVLLLVALVNFAWPVVTELSGSRAGLDDFFAGVIAGATLAAVTIAAPQLLYLIARWVKSGFEDPSNDSDPQ